MRPERWALDRGTLEQEDQLGALGLVLNAAMLWTTRYLDAAEYPRGLPAHEREHRVLDEDVARVSPLKHADLHRLRAVWLRRPPAARGASEP